MADDKNTETVAGIEQSEAFRSASHPDHEQAISRWRELAVKGVPAPKAEEPASSTPPAGESAERTTARTSALKRIAEITSDPKKFADPAMQAELRRLYQDAYNTSGDNEAEPKSAFDLPHDLLQRAGLHVPDGVEHLPEGARWDGPIDKVVLADFSKYMLDEGIPAQRGQGILDDFANHLTYQSSMYADLDRASAFWVNRLQETHGLKKAQAENIARGYRSWLAYVHEEESQ